MKKVAGLVPPIATPFRDGALDPNGLARILDDLADKVSGVLVGGSVGETASLTMEERITVMRQVAGGIGDSMYLAVSISDNAIENSRRLSEAAGEAGADLLVVSAPNYYVNDGAMLEAYFAALSDFASADLCLYDNPIATHTTLTVADIVALTQAAPRLTHVKVTDTALDKVDALRRATTLVVLSGDDAVLWHQLTLGAEGGMVALPMIYPERAMTFWRAFTAGDLEAAEREYRQVAHFIHVCLGASDYVQVIKAVLHHRNVISSPEVRLPLVALSQRRRNEVISSL